ncbi:MAG: single-stranded DNA-binding protein [Phycisphaerales bacterium]|nr:single-stranded DNA-binding protein [Phycisphaerales bacterium]
MANLNKVLLMGNITRDPELSYLPTNQMPVCEFGLAVNRTWIGPDGIKKEEVTFIDCSCFGKPAEIISNYKKKGDPIYLEGRLKLDQWQAQDGTKRSRMRVIVENFQFLNRAQPGGYGGGGGAPQAATIPPEYASESAANAPAPSYAPRPQQRPTYSRPPVGRPAPAVLPAAPSAQPAPNYEAGDPPPPDDAPPISNDDIPF